MQTIKTIVVVALLLTVCFGAYKAMNAPDVEMPEDLKTWADQNGKDVLPDFEIPAITSNDTLGGSNNDKMVGSANDISLPQFPAVDFAGTSLAGNPASAATPNSNASNPVTLPKLPALSSSLSAAPTLGSSNPPSLTNTQLANGSVPNLTPATTNGIPANGNPATSLSADAAGPTIPFNPSLPNSTPGTTFPVSGASLSTDVNSSIANELIDAAAGGLGAPIPSSPTNFSGTLTGLGNSAALEPNGPGSTVSATIEQKTAPPTQPFSVARSEALQIASQGKLREALELMSQYYESPDLGYAEHTDLVDILDALTREVIYSDRHLLASPHTVSAQDSLQSLAAQYNLNPEFLAAVNKMGSSQALVPNSQIKVIEGPFHAQVSLSRGELTLFLRKLYAGRFPVSISQKNRPPHARYEIVDRRQDRTYYGANVRIAADDPSNPYGGFWLSLGSDYSIHGSPEQVTTDLENAGCISLAPLDASDVYRILGKGAAVEIKQ